MNQQEILQEEKSISLSDIFFVIKKNIIMIGAITFLCAIAGCIYGFKFKDTTYTATATAMVDSGQNLSTDASVTTSTYTLSNNLLNTFKDFIVSNLVIKDVVSELKAIDPVKYENITIDGIKNRTTVNVSTTNSLIVEISYKAANDQIMAVQVVNQIAESTQKLANEYTVDGVDDNGNPVKVYKYKTLANNFVIIDEIDLDNEYYTKNLNKYVDSSRGALKVIIICIAVGLVISCGIAFVRYLIDDTYTSKDDFEKQFQINVLTLVPDFIALENAKNAKAKKSGGRK